MEKIKISKGFTLKLAGDTDLSVIGLPFPPTIGCCAGDIPFIRPKLLVKEGDRIKTGTPVFSDKRDLSIQYVSPATGRVKQIIFGERRRLLEVIIDPEKTDEFIEYDPISPAGMADMPKPDLVDRLKQGGLWQGMRQFPAMDTADPDHTPAMIIVSLNGNDIFSPHPGPVLKGKIAAFETGMALLKRFSHRVVVTVRQSSLKDPGLDSSIEKQITHVTGDTYPAWHPGAVLFNLKQNEAENTSWCISLDHLLMMGQFLMTGRYPVEELVTVSRDNDRRPHIRARRGAPINTIAGSLPPGGLATTGQFNGRILDSRSHLGFFENTINIIGPGRGEEMFGFVRPGIDKPTVSATFLSSLLPSRSAPLDCTLHGELRACINCSYCERICPNDLMPSFIMKALHADEVEEALSLGLLDCCQCGLCSYTCPSKIELTKILADGIDSHYKDKA